MARIVSSIFLLARVQIFLQFCSMESKVCLFLREKIRNARTKLTLRKPYWKKWKLDFDRDSSTYRAIAFGSSLSGFQIEEQILFYTLRYFTNIATEEINASCVFFPPLSFHSLEISWTIGLLSSFRSCFSSLYNFYRGQKFPNIASLQSRVSRRKNL